MGFLIEGVKINHDSLDWRCESEFKLREPISFRSITKLMIRIARNLRGGASLNINLQKEMWFYFSLTAN